MDDELKQLLEAMRQEIVNARQDTADARQEIANARQDTANVRQEIANARQDTADARLESRRHTDEKIEESRRHTDKLIEENRRHFEVIAERLESRIELVAEGVTHCNERLDRLDAKVDRFAADVAQEFVETRAMIKFSHHELDRRLRTLEEVVADLQSRVERLESTTH